MSAPLTSEEEARYGAIIDGILSTADLATITRKKVRQGLEVALGNKDLNAQKEAIKDLIVRRFDAVATVESIAPPPANSRPKSVKREYDDETNHTSNSYERHNDTSSASPTKHSYDGSADSKGSFATAGSSPPPKKKNKRPTAAADDDARIAAALQEEENRMARGRTTRGASAPTKPKKAKSKTPKKKSAAKVKDGDDSEVDSDGAEPKKRKAGGGFMKPFNLSYALADLVGVDQLSRPQVVKKLWDHIKANELQDPSDKRQIICDEKLTAVFRQEKLNMFHMNKLIGSHLYPIEGEE